MSPHTLAYLFRGKLGEAAGAPPSAAAASASGPEWGFKSFEMMPRRMIQQLSQLVSRWTGVDERGTDAKEEQRKEKADVKQQQAVDA